ncbi:MAG: pyridoxamine 5'-phosphate oxidase family protein [Oscillospiraceae bacterium]|nr:pyridoxamine 5'-phosphate oxidase family protein [Oscillospiraceae bacterium]
MDKVFDLVKEAGTFFLATSEANGQPRVRPFGFFMKLDGKLYFGGGKHKPFFQQITANPKFEICAWAAAKGQWVRIAGTAVLDDSEAVYEAAIADSPNLKGMYPESKLLGNFYIKDATATISSFAGDPEVINF